MWTPFGVDSYLLARSRDRAALVWVSSVAACSQGREQGKRGHVWESLISFLTAGFLSWLSPILPSSDVCTIVSMSMSVPSSAFPRRLLATRDLQASCPATVDWTSHLGALWELPSVFPPQPGPNPASLSFHCAAPAAGTISFLFGVDSAALWRSQCVT